MMYQNHQAPYLQTVTGFLHHTPLPALPPPPNLHASNATHHQHFQANSNVGDAAEWDASASSSASSSSASAAIVLFESRQTNRELRLQLTDAQLKLDRLLAKVDEIGSSDQRSSDVVLRSSSSSLTSNGSGFESGPLRISYFQLTRENDELKSRLSEMTIKLQSHQDNISRLLDGNQKLLEQNVDLMGKSFDSPGSQSRQLVTSSQDAALMMNSLSGVAAANEELETLKVELSSTRARETECQRQIEKLIKVDQETKQQLQLSDLQLKDLSQTTERLNVELSEEKRRRKEAEMTSRALATDAEDNKTKNATLQKTLSELKTSSKLKIMELENDIKTIQDNHQKELSTVKERFKKDKSRVQDDHSEMLRLTEESLVSSWKRKCENLERTLKDRHSIQVDELSAEKSFLVDRVASLEQKMTELKFQRTAEESSRAALLSEMEEYKTWKAKYENLRGHAIAMKDKYTQQIEELKEESSGLEEKCSRMTDKYYKAEESLNIATQKYEEFKIHSLDGREGFEVKVIQLESELSSTKSELEEAQRREVQIQLKLNETTNKYRRLTETSEAMEKEHEREYSHVVQKTVAPLARTERTKTQGDTAPYFSPHDDAKGVLRTPLGGASNSYEYERIVEQQTNEQEHEEQEEERPEVREPEEVEVDDDEDSFVTALDDGEDAIDVESKDVTCSGKFLSIDNAISRSDDLEKDLGINLRNDLGNDLGNDLENDRVVDSHLDLRHDSRATSSVDLDILRNSLQKRSPETSVHTAGHLDESNRGSPANDLEIQRGSNFADDKSNDLGMRFDLNSENDLERAVVANQTNESDSTLPNKTTGATSSFDLSSSASSESATGNLHSPTESDLQSGDDLEKRGELDLIVVLDSTSEQSASDNLQRITQVPSLPAMEAMSSAPTSSQNPKSEATSNLAAAAVNSSPNQNGCFEHKVGIAGKLENTGHGKLPIQSKPEGEQEEPVCSSSNKDDHCNRNTLAEYFEHKGHDGAAGELENIEGDNIIRSESQSQLPQSSSFVKSTDGNWDEEIFGENSELMKKHGGKSGQLESSDNKEEHIFSPPEIESEKESTSSTVDKDGFFDDNYDGQEKEDSTFTVTSGGKIVAEFVAEDDGGGVLAGGGLFPDRDGGQKAEDVVWRHEQLGVSKNGERPPSSKSDPADRPDVEWTPVNELDQTRKSSKEWTGTSSGSFEDPVYTVTSGGQIIPGWTDIDDPIPDGLFSHRIPEVDWQHLSGRSTDFDAVEAPDGSSSAIGITDAPEARFSQPEVTSGTSGVLVRKPEDPVSRFGACVILREEDIEKMREKGRRNDPTEKKEEKKEKKEKEKKEKEKKEKKKKSKKTSS